MAMGGITFDFVVGNSYPVFRGEQSAQLTFLGHVSDERGHNVLLFHNPTLIGAPYEFVGAQPRTVWPTTAGQTTVTLTLRLVATYVGQSPDSLTILSGSQANVWGSGTQ